MPIFAVHQVHGDGVDVVTEADLSPAGRPVSAIEADGLVTALTGVGLGIRTADCAPVLLWSPEGVLGAAHGGWGGLEVGIIGAVARSMTDLGATTIDATLGPCIGPECYEFGAEPLARLDGAQTQELLLDAGLNTYEVLECAVDLSLIHI